MSSHPGTASASVSLVNLKDETENQKNEKNWKSEWFSYLYENMLEVGPTPEYFWYYYGQLGTWVGLKVSQALALCCLCALWSASHPLMRLKRHSYASAIITDGLCYVMLRCLWRTHLWFLLWGPVVEILKLDIIRIRWSSHRPAFR